MYKLSKTAKMPGKSFSLPASRCQTGSCLAQIKGTVCSSCYARKGTYCYPAVKKVREDNYQTYLKNRETFLFDIPKLIHAEYKKTKVPYFRWFDSGDLISAVMLMDLVIIAQTLPEINFWLPTKEVEIVSSVLKRLEELEITLPSNLSVRLSAFMIDGSYFSLPVHMSAVRQTRVISSIDKKLESEVVCNGDCKSCSYKCWKSDVNIAYVKH